MTGKTFCALFGTQASCSELLLLKRRVMGPSWLALSGAAAVPEGAQRSWCRLEVRLSGGKGVASAAPVANAAPRDAPPLVVASLNLKTVLNHRANVNEVAAASVVLCRAASIEAPMGTSEWNTPSQLRHFSIVRRLDGVSFPPGWEDAVAAENGSHPTAKRTGAPVLHSAASERALLGLLLARLAAADPDVIVGHNIAGFDLDVLLHRLQATKVAHWSRLGRLKRSRFPSLGGGGGAFGGGAGAGALGALAGRLLADTYLAAREYCREVSYTLTALAQRQLGLPRNEIASADIPGRYAAAAPLLELAKASEADAWLALGLLFHFNVLPLTRQLTCLSGSLWAKTLAGARAQRIEYLLLHEFHSRKYLLPDKLSFKERARVAKAALAEDGGDGDDDAGDDAGGGGGGGKGGARKRGAPAYAGGLVLEPKKGLYDKYVLLLDFNSLYPSIIQEYNICFTTVARPDEASGAMAPLPPPAPGGPGGDGAAVLPQVLRRLVQRRRAVKDLLKSERDPAKRRQLDTRQQALKLTANSMYGCLGFTGSRFYAKPLAELVTCQGREILQATVDLVRSGSFSVGAGAAKQTFMNLDVIYGDTDSIMIATGTDDLRTVKAIGAAVKREVNKRYQLLEIEQDGVFKAMLLLKKKKYAALKVEEKPDGSLTTVLEAKGLDIVRRDWCGLSKDVGNAALSEILSGKSADDVVESIHGLLRDCAARVASGDVPLEAFIITKALTKRPEDYNDAASQPHVQVALRRAAAGKRDGIAAGETVPYVICVSAAAADAAAGAAAAGAGATGSGKGLAERAYHPEEVIPGGPVAVDVGYYLAQQVHPVVSRLCAPIEGTDAGQLAEALGLEAARFKGAAGNGNGSGGGGSRDDALLGAPTLDDDERFAGCAPLTLRRRDGAPFAFAGAAALVAGALPHDALLGATTPGAKTASDAAAAVSTVALAPLSAASVANQVTLAANALVSRYYDGWMRSDDELYPCDTRNLTLRASRDAPLGAAPPDAKCGGRMGRVFGEAELYRQLCHLRRLFDLERALSKLEKGAPRDAAARAAAPAREALRAGFEAADAICARSAYRYVSLRNLCIS
jgi:DNA polymerase alpha subunit A